MQKPFHFLLNIKKSFNYSICKFQILREACKSSSSKVAKTLAKPTKSETVSPTDVRPTESGIGADEHVNIDVVELYPIDKNDHDQGEAVENTPDQLTPTETTQTPEHSFNVDRYKTKY